jgi:hypothetical protein
VILGWMYAFGETFVSSRTRVRLGRAGEAICPMEAYSAARDDIPRRIAKAIVNANSWYSKRLAEQLKSAAT